MLEHHISQHTSPSVTRLHMATLAPGIVLGAWAVLFWYLLLTGRWSEFLAARVSWLIPVAAIIFSLASIAQLSLVFRRQQDAWSSRSAMGVFIAALMPVLLVLSVPIDPLSSFAAERRSSFSGQFAATDPITEDGRLTFQQVLGAQSSPTLMEILRDRAGDEIELVGVVTAPRPGEGFVLTRFVIACCVVDATVASIEVRRPGPIPDENSWVSVSGEFLVDDDGSVAIGEPIVAPTTRPEPPYLYPGL